MTRYIILFAVVLAPLQVFAELTSLEGTLVWRNIESLSRILGFLEKSSVDALDRGLVVTKNELCAMGFIYWHNGGCANKSINSKVESLLMLYKKAISTSEAWMDHDPLSIRESGSDLESNAIRVWKAAPVKGSILVDPAYTSAASDFARWLLNLKSDSSRD